MNGLLDILKGRNWDKKKVSIIVSTGRTGTKYFSSIFSKQGTCLAEHEPKPIGNDIGVQFLEGGLSEEELISFLKENRKSQMRTCFNENKALYLESNGGLIFFLPILNAVFPNLRVAHIIRNPIDFVRSGCSRPGIENPSEARYQDDSKWLLKAAELKNDSYASKWSDMSMAERFMWTWNKKNSFAVEAAKKSKDIRSFRFEDIFSDQVKMDELLSFLSHDLDLDWSQRVQDKSNKTSSFLFPEYKDWDDSLKAQLQEHCGNLMSEFNYNND